MLAEPLAPVFATRERRGRDELAGLPELTVDGLHDTDARGLLSVSVGGPMDAQVRDRILAEARGNPLALLELPHDRPDMGTTDGLRRSGPGPVSGRIERSYLGRVQALPASTRRLLLVAAAEPIGDVALAQARRRAAGHRPGRDRPGGGGRAARRRRTRPVPAPAAALRRLSLGRPRGNSGRPTGCWRR
ncbi:hypothetical protein [Streptomyces sp. KL116D]|uniref:hypothetical protein n=1 Tax=Streptomyces sp. KL116D TaxID=3045152 RepID=UPI003556EA02